MGGKKREGIEPGALTWSIRHQLKPLLCLSESETDLAISLLVDQSDRPLKHRPNHGGTLPGQAAKLICFRLETIEDHLLNWLGIDKFSWLASRLIPEAYCPPAKPASQPSEHRPQSDGRIEDYRNRVANGEEMYHPDDKRHIDHDDHMGEMANGEEVELRHLRSEDFSRTSRPTQEKTRRTALP